MDSTEIITAGYLKQIGKIQTVAQTHVKSASAAKVLGVTATTYVRVSETLTGEVRLAGRENLELVLLTEDGLVRESGWTDYTDRAEIDGVTPSTRVFATGKVLDTEVVSNDGGNITLASVIEITLMSEETSVVPPPISETEGVFTGDSRLVFSRLVSRISGKATVTAEETPDIARLICADARVILNGAEAGLDSVTATGDIMIDGLGVSSDGSLQSFSLTVPMSEELEAEGTRRGDEVFLRVLSASVASEESENGTTLTVTAEFVGYVYSELAVSCAVDAFAADCELELTKQDVCGVMSTGKKFTSVLCDGTVTLPEGENADKVLCTCGFNVSALTAYAEAGKTVVEGAVTGTVIYSDAEAGRRSSCAAELPFRFVVDLSAEEGDIIDVSGAVGKITVRPSRLGELTLRCEVCLCVCGLRPFKSEVISSVTRGEEYPDRKGTITMHVAREGETLWESAKELRVTPDTVLSQNPDLEFPLKRGDKVFVYRVK